MEALIMADADWTPAVGWRKAAVRLVVCGAVSMGVSLGAAGLVVWLCGKVEQAAGGQLPSVPWIIWGTSALVAGGIGGLLVGRKVVEQTGLVGAPLVAAALAALALAHIGAYSLAIALFGRTWENVFFMVHSGACIAAGALAAAQILKDS
jgi:hypothetical protein